LFGASYLTPPRQVVQYFEYNGLQGMRTSNSRKVLSKAVRNGQQIKIAEGASKPKARVKKPNLTSDKRYSLALASETKNKRPVVIRTPIPENEAERLECLHKNQILNSDPAELFDDLAHLAATVCIASYALITLVESDYIWCKSMVGFTSFESLPREGSFDAWAIAGDEVFVVEDATQDVRFNFHPLVTAHPRIRFYAAVPLITSDGHALGTLSVMDWRPRALKAFQAKALKTLALDVVSQIELRRKNRELEQAIAERDRLIVMPAQVIQAAEPLPAQEPAVKLTLVPSQAADLAITPVFVESSASLDSFSNDGLWEWELTTNQMNYSKMWKATIGYDENEIGTSPNEWFNRVHPEDAEKLHSSILNHLSGQTPCFKSEHRILGSDGVYRWVQSRGQLVLDSDGKPGSLFGTLTGLGNARDMEDWVKHNAYHDSITGLPNRTMFLKRLKRMMDRSERGECKPFAVLIFDIDRFKSVNDTYGHVVADELLAMFAMTLKNSLRPEDILARVGSDEFAIILDNLRDANEAIIAADRLKEGLIEHFEVEGNEIFISACVGIAHSAYQCDQPEDLFRNAEAALLRAKEGGRDGCEFFDSEMLGRIVALSRVEKGLGKAIQRNELALYYQPIISLVTYQIIGFEALLRWQHPKQGLIMPNDFIPIAEETGQIIQVDNWVFSEAAKQARRWQSQFPSDIPLSISVNISGRRFLQKDLADYIKGVLRETGVRPECLKLEITESAIIENVENATETLMKIKDLGLQVSLDDFGKGYSSFNYLQQFPVDVLKIDHSFISTMDSPKNLQIVNSMIVLANSLGLKVVAEGVERGEQIIQLSGMDCQYVQGFLFSKPLPLAAATALLAETNPMMMRNAVTA
jgi:diguanylate cyclase (GGDEF)-like protein/PAS domain S-box-containing protein